MQYTKPELNLIGAAEGLVLGTNAGSEDGANQMENLAATFEFEE